MNRKKYLLIIAMSLYCLGYVFADDYHFNNFFVGDRAASMGGAYCAIADGPEGVYYNPAGLSFSSASYFSLSANAIQYKQMTYKGIEFNGAEESVDYTRRSFSFIPNFFGFLQKYKHFTFAFTVASPDSELYDQRDSFKIPSASSGGASFTNNLNVDLSKTYMVYETGPSFSFLPSKQLAIGFGILVRYTNNRQIFQQGQILDVNGSSQSSYISEYSRDDIVSLVNNFGVQYMPIKYLSIGYSFNMPLHLVDVKTSKLTNINGINDNNITDGNIGYMTASVDSKEGKVLNIFEKGLFRTTFVKQTIGIAGFINKSVVVSADGSFYIAVQDLENEYAKEHNWFTWNFSTGVEWYITQNFPLRVGFFTDNANTPELDDNKTNQLDHVNLYGGSLSVGYSTSSMSVNVGAMISGGIGEAQMISNSTQIQELDAFAVTVFISGGYSF